jgi:outer membrane lipopolysaccharide assembly protein LptE/RlpB
MMNFDREHLQIENELRELLAEQLGRQLHSKDFNSLASKLWGELQISLGSQIEHQVWSQLYHDEV